MGLLPGGPGTGSQVCLLLIVCSLTIIADPGSFLSENHVPGCELSAKLGSSSVNEDANNNLSGCEGKIQWSMQIARHRTWHVGKCFIKRGCHLDENLPRVCSVPSFVPRTPTRQDCQWGFLMELTCIWHTGPGESNSVLSTIGILLGNVLGSFPAAGPFPQVLTGNYNFPLFKARNILKLYI